VSGHTHDHDPVDPPQLHEVSDGVFAYIQPDGTWFINNAGFVTSSDGVVAIDTCATEKRSRDFLSKVSGVTNAPLRTLINTHHHGDHTHGNYLTYPATIIGHENARTAMIGTGIQHYEGVFESPDWGTLNLAPPTVTFSDHVNVWAGDLKLELHYIGTSAHTNNDVVIWIPERKVLYTGDLVFNGGTPFVVMGSLAGARRSLQRLREFDAEVVVPGHGPVCDLSVLDSLDRYYAFVQNLAVETDRAGIGVLEAARSVDLGEFGELGDSERIVGNLHRALFELKGGGVDEPMNIMAAIGDMVAYNGGKPLRCVA
jgi:cyclase